MSADLPEPGRWCDLPARADSAEHALGAVLRRVRDATDPSDAALGRLGRRTEAATPSVPFWLVWRVVLAAILIMATGGAVGAALYRWRQAAAVEAARGAATLAAPTPPARAKYASRRGARAHEANTEEPPPAVSAEAPPVEVAEPPAPAAPEPTPTVVGRSPAHRTATATTTPAPASEPAQLAEVFRQLRSGGDDGAAAALRALDQYDRRFPDGVLHDEARIARVQALLTLNRRGEALQLLERIGGTTLTREVQATRGELLAEAGRCALAIRDFDRILQLRDSDAAGARALFGRASCAQRAGDVRAARDDLNRYLLAHPNGPQAAAARRALSGSP